MQTDVYLLEEPISDFAVCVSCEGFIPEGMNKMTPGKFDLEERLLEFSTRIISVADAIKRSPAGNHVADQLMRSGTSSYGHHGEAEGAESRADFVHKLRICYKELRETRRWLRLVERVPLIAQPEALTELLDESDQLIRIFAASIRTAEANRETRKTT